MNYVDHSILMVHRCRFGGIPEDYNEINKFIDSTKLHLGSFLHRAISHNTWMIDVCERIYGSHIINSHGNHIAVRDIVIAHIKQDCNGKVPTIQEWVQAIASNSRPDWMAPDKGDLKWLKEYKGERSAKCKLYMYGKYKLDDSIWGRIINLNFKADGKDQYMWIKEKDNHQTRNMSDLLRDYYVFSTEHNLDKHLNTDLANVIFNEYYNRSKKVSFHT